MSRQTRRIDYGGGRGRSRRERQVKTLHERAALLQELSWRPPYTTSRNPDDRESVGLIAFSFLDDQLFKMAVGYDQSRTKGLTRDDMIAALSAIYGPASTPRAVTPRPAFESLDTPRAPATWLQGDTSVTLNEVSYGGGFGLIITSVSLEGRARQAQVSAASLDAREAPARAKAEADAERASAEKTRTTNKSVFKP